MIIVDRLENGFAVCETEDGIKNIELSLLPETVREGSVLRYVNGEYLFDTNAESERRQRNFSLQQKLFKKNEP